MSIRHNHLNPTFEEAFPAGWRQDRKAFASGASARVSARPIAAPIVIPLALDTKKIDALQSQVAALMATIERLSKVISDQKAELHLQAEIMVSLRSTSEKARSEAKRLRQIKDSLSERLVNMERQNAGTVNTAAGKIAQETAEKFNTTFASVLRQARGLAACRQEIMHRLRTELGWSFPEIGHFMKRDHSTVLYGCEAHLARIEGRPPPSRPGAHTRSKSARMEGAPPG